ncbi:mannosyltransferase [Sabulilitoribacter multivorans]|uniref:Mannosyltransferase n=1 Tax=Flaviramulus multivorans TaxID=1304750 RepID=A0ABS9IKW6_9FLAO|nr:mannosyltransferase [Flaviramulus multivorans]MCF7561232.1 mannosyltransferase [Flaviramulus multivorans]
MLFNPALLKLYKTPLLLVLASALFYTVFAYDLVRTDYVKLVSIYAALFFLFYKLVQIFKSNFKALTYIAFGFRAIFILAIPNLSQDFYRFIWDGRLILEGFNPYLYTVDAFTNNAQFPVSQAQELREGMGNLNASHFTNYPPINQLCFVIAGLFAGKSILGSVVVMRLLIIAADFGTLHFGKKLLEELRLPAYNIFWYVLNPFIIIELTGNLHFEGVMIFFLVWSLYLLHCGKWQWAAMVFAVSISTKLIPLIFLPLFFQWFITTRTTKQSDTIGKVASSSLTPSNKAIKGIIKLISFYSIVIITTILLFAPFYSSAFLNNYTQTVALWFKNFEFNASLYYIAREIGYSFRDRNEIAVIGKVIPYIIIVFVLIITFFRRNKTTLQLITAMLLVLTFYYFTATTIHPWYIATLVILSVFTKYKFPLVWSFVIILSYLSYLNINKADKSENLWIIALEYIIVYGVFIWEVFIKKAPKMEASI